MTRNKGFAPIIILIVIVVIVAIAGSYYLGNKNVMKSVVSIGSPVPSSVVSDTKWQMYTSEKNKQISYPIFIIQNINGEWSAARDTTDDINISYTFFKGDYKINILQGAMDGSICIFNDSLAYEGPSETLTNRAYVQINSNIGVLRRYESNYPTPANTRRIDFCEKVDKYFQIPTEIGLIRYVLPQNFDPGILTEMDKLVQSLNVVK